MCPNRLLSLMFLIVFLATAGTARADTFRISFLAGDAHVAARTIIGAVKAVKSEYPAYAGTTAYHYFPSKEDRAFLGKSSLVFVMLGNELSESGKKEIGALVAKGVRVYGVGDIDEKACIQMGMLFDRKVNEYYENARGGNRENLKNMILFVLKRDFGFNVAYRDVIRPDSSGIYDRRTKGVFQDFDSFRRSYPLQDESRPWVGLTLFRTAVFAEDLDHIDELIRSLEREGLNVLPVFDWPPERAVERFFFDEAGQSRVQAVVEMNMKMHADVEKARRVLERLGVPVINAVTVSQTRQEWEKSPAGIGIMERVTQIDGPELAGSAQPTVFASKEQVVDEETSIVYTAGRAIPERTAVLAKRVKAWINLRQKTNNQKKVAIIYYNYPPGKQNIGASYLNVLPDSLYGIYTRLKAEGYNLGEISREELFRAIQTGGRNIGNWAGGEIDRLVRKGLPVLIPMVTYKEWFARLPEPLRKEILKSWGPPEKCTIMTWKEKGGPNHFLLPVVRLGNVFFMPQPLRGLEQDVKKLYHDITVPPHHQYVAFYLWLKNAFAADAVVHLGTHGTHEWLPGKEVGFTGADASEALIQDIPNIYPYIVDNVGEGLQAKRRGMAVIIDHLTPPLDKAGLNKELKEIAGLITDYTVAKEKSPAIAEGTLGEINRLAKKTGLLTDLKMGRISTEEEIEEVEHHIKEIMETRTPFGLHTFGKAPEEKYRRSTAKAVVSVEKGLPEEARNIKIADIEDRIVRSARNELDSLMAALSGRYVPTGPGNDPVRNPDSLPTGRNFYAFDPSRIPSKATYELGAKLAGDLINGYRKRHGRFPDKLTFNLWGVETIRHEGVMDSQILSLMGIRPVWDERGKVVNVQAIPRKELGRPRIDVILISSGLYRDLFPALMMLHDKAVTLAKQQEEEDNALRMNVQKLKAALVKKGVDEKKAERLASVRIFTVPPGAYGTNLDKIIPSSSTWEKEKEITDVFFNRMGHLYGQGFWGDKERHQGEDLSDTVMKKALSGTKMVVHSRSSNIYATLDNDDFFQYLGGTAMAIRAIDGKTPEVFVTNLSNPKAPKQETLEAALGREMRARYLNPEWIKAMMKEGYAGARFVDKVVEHLWGWQVTVPEAVDAAKWNEMYETYVLDRNGLGIKEQFRQAKNLYAYQSLVARMLETVRKKYWKPDDTVVQTLAAEYARTVNEVGLACSENTCNNPPLSRLTASTLRSVPGLRPLHQGFTKALASMKGTAKETGPRANREGGAQAAGRSAAASRAPGGKAAGETVAGYEMQEAGVPASGASPGSIPYLFLAGFMVIAALIFFGFRKKR